MAVAKLVGYEVPQGDVQEVRVRLGNQIIAYDLPVEVAREVIKNGYADLKLTKGDQKCTK